MNLVLDLLLLNPKLTSMVNKLHKATIEYKWKNGAHDGKKMSRISNTNGKTGPVIE